MAQKHYTAGTGLYIPGDTFFGGDVLIKGDLILKSGARLEANTATNGDYVQFFEDVDLANNKIINVGDPILSTDAANMDYVYKKVGEIIAGAPTEHLQILNDIEYALANGTVNGSSIALQAKADVVYADNLLASIQQDVLAASSSIGNTGVTTTNDILISAQDTLLSYEQYLSAFNSYLISFDTLKTSINSALPVEEEVAINRAKYYVDGQIYQIMGWAPSTLDTLSELANAIDEMESGVFTTVQTEINKKIDRSAFDAVAATKQDSINAVMWNNTNNLYDPGGIWKVDIVEAEEFIGDGSGLTGLVSPDELPIILDQITQLEEMMTKLEEKVGVLVGPYGPAYSN